MTLILLRLKLLLENWSAINHQELITFHHNRLKDEVKHYILKPTNLFILSVIRKKCHSTEETPLLNLFLWEDNIKRVLREKCVDLNHFTQETIQQRTHVNTVLNLQVQKSSGKFLTSRLTTFSRTVTTELVTCVLNRLIFWQFQYTISINVPHRGFNLLTVSSPDSSMLRCRSARIFFSNGVQIPCPIVNFSCTVSPYS